MYFVQFLSAMRLPHVVWQHWRYDVMISRYFWIFRFQCLVQNFGNPYSSSSTLASIWAHAQKCILFNFCPVCHTVGPVHWRSSRVLKDLNPLGFFAHYVMVLSLKPYHREPTNLANWFPSWPDWTFSEPDLRYGIPDKSCTKCSTVQWWPQCCRPIDMHHHPNHTCTAKKMRKYIFIRIPFLKAICATKRLYEI